MITCGWTRAKNRSEHHEREKKITQFESDEMLENTEQELFPPNTNSTESWCRAKCSREHQSKAMGFVLMTAFIFLC